MHDDVEVIASYSYGKHKFTGWYLNNSQVSNGTHLVIPKNADSYVYEARYKD